MSVRKRTWTNAKGEEKTAWVVDYVDAKGKRRLKTFKLKKDADKFEATASVEVREGTHVADRDTVTVAKAGALWITSGKNAGLERSTINQRQQHLTFHIEPFIGETLLSKLTVPAIRDFEDRLRQEGRSPAMVKKVIGSLSSILTDAQERGLAARNPVRDIRSRRSADRRQEKRHKGRLKVGEDIPTREEVKALVASLTGRFRPLLLTAIFAGLRSSELRGLRWRDVDLEARTISVHQRADAFGDIGRPKSGAGERTIPIPPILVNTLREWKLACPKGELGLVFPNGAGKIESHGNIINRGLHPAWIAAGVTTKLPDGTIQAKYTGLHSLRHFYASWLINRREDGGLGLPLKVVQERMGHSSITMTADTYGHMFPRDDHADELAAAEAALLN